MLTSLLDHLSTTFESCEDVRDALLDAAAEHRDLVEHACIGTSESGRPIDAFKIGKGPLKVCLLAGAHADEPVGPQTLRSLILDGLNDAMLVALCDHCSFYVLPHINPDGEANNKHWMDYWPDPAAYFADVVRELPGRDLEFGYPAMRQENQFVHQYLAANGPFDLYMSLHGMSMAEGCLLLIDREWIDHTASMREQWHTMVEDYGYDVHDHDRGGEKGFDYIAPGFTTTPRGEAMREYFEAQDDPTMAAKFNDSSMEAVRKLGGDPLCIVTELPLFLLDTSKAKKVPGKAVIYEQAREAKAKLIGRPGDGSIYRDFIEKFGLKPMPMKDAMTIQLRTIMLAIETVQSVYPDGQAVSEEEVNEESKDG